MKKIKLMNRLSLLAVIIILQTNFAKAQMVGTNAYIKATNVEVGIAGLGGFEGVPTGTSPVLSGMHPRSATGFFGFVANPQLDGWATFDGDFFTPGTPENGWGFEIGTTSGISAGNNCASLQQIDGAITSWTHTYDCYSSDWEGDYTSSGTDLHFKINYFLQETDLFYTTTVSITNRTAATIPDMYYYRNLDPDNNVELSGSYTTQNTIISQPGTGCNLAHVKATQSTPWNSYLGLAAVGANWRADYGGFSNRDASNLWTGTGFTQTIAATNFADEAIALAYRIQNLAPGATETFKFVVILDDASADQAINNLLYLSYPGSFGSPPAVCTPYNDTIRTCGGPVPISVSGSTVADFNWTWSPSAGLTPSTGPSIIADPAVTTTYTASGAPLSVCVAPVTLTFVVQVTPGGGASPVITPVPPICVSNPPINLSVDSAGGTWSGTGITNSTLGTFNPTTAGIGTYMITYTRPGLCNTTDTVMITVNTGPNPTITAVPLTCIGDSAFNLSAVTGGGVWSGTGITNSSLGTFDPTTAGVGPHVITYSVSGTCSAIDTVTITITSAFNSTITPQANVCEGSAPLNFAAATAGGTWSGTGITAGGTFTPSTPGTFVITYTLPGACGSFDTENITVLPQANATITAAAPLCANAPSINLTGVSPGGTWSGTGVTAGGTFDPAVSGPGTFTITYSIVGTCGDTATTSLTVHPSPTPSFTSNINTICTGQCIDFNESVSTSCSSVIYHFGDGDSSLTSAPTHCYPTAGDYSVSLQCTDSNGCVGSINNSNMIHVIDYPVADFTMTPNSTIEPGTTVSFSNTSSATGVISAWDFDDLASGVSNTSILNSPSHTYSNEGDYCITLISSNVAGCTDTVKYCLIVIGEGTISIPNVFTPNGDATNDVFVVGNHNMKQISYQIFDRWGVVIAEYNGLTGGWNGECKNGKMASDGTYFYILNATALNNKTYTYQGYIQLLSK